jgi:flagellar basal body rod protein FlgG
MYIKALLLSVFLTSTSALSRIVVTNQPFDLLIVGKASFGLIEESGNLAYTTNGSFIVNKDGLIVNRLGQKLFPGIKLPKETLSINIDLNGQVEVYLKEKKSPKYLGQVAVFKKEDNKTYTNITGNDDNVEVHQGKLYLEN